MNLEKDAGGDILGRLAGLVTRPFLGAQRSQGVQNAVIGGITKHINQPIEAGLRRAGVHKAISKAYEIGTTPVPGPLGRKVIPGIGQPYMPDVAQRRAYGNWKADDIVHTVSNHPEMAVMGPATAAISPMMAAFPTGSTYMGAKTLAGRALGVKKLASYMPAFEDEMIKIAKVTPYQQKTQWTCSAACLKAVFAHHGIDIPEMQAIEAVGAQKGRGAECDQIAEAARKLGFAAFEYSFDSIDQAKILLDQDIPIICDIQSFNHPGKGHYVVMVSADEAVELMDPNTPGNWRSISREEMEDRWWDRAMAPPHDLMPHWGIVIVPPEEPSATPPV